MSMIETDPRRTLAATMMRGQRDVGRLEAAGPVDQWVPTAIPGCMQTQEYAAAVITAANVYTDEQVAQVVADRMVRASILRTVTAHRRRCLVTRAGIEREILASAAMSRQWAQMADLAQLEHIEVRVVPEHISVLTPAQLSVGGTTLPYVPRSRAYRAGPEQAVIWSPADDVMIAGDLMAPDLPDLSHISPTRAMDGLQYAVAHAPLVVIGSHGNVISARAQVADGGRVEPRHLATVEDMRMRLDYVRDIATVAHAGAAQGLTPRAAAFAGWDGGVLSRWSCQDPQRQTRLNYRHLVNMHSAMAAEHGQLVDLAAAHADAQALTTP